MLKFNFSFNTPVNHFLKYFRAKLREILMSGSQKEEYLQNQKAIPHSIECFDFLRVRFGNEEKAKGIARFFASLTFVTCLRNKT